MGALFWVLQPKPLNSLIAWSGKKMLVINNKPEFSDDGILLKPVY